MKRVGFVKPHWTILIVLFTMDLGWMLVDLGLVNCGPLAASPLAFCVSSFVLENAIQLHCLNVQLRTCFDVSLAEFPDQFCPNKL